MFNPPTYKHTHKYRTELDRKSHTVPHGPAARVEEGAVLVVMVTVVGIKVTGDNVL